MTEDAFSKGSSKGASQGAGRSKDSEVVCWYCEKKGHRASDCRKKQKDHDEQPKGSKKGDSKGQGNKKEFKGKDYTCGKMGHMSKDCRSTETSAFEAGDELAEKGCIEMASIDLTALEIGVVQWSKEDRKLRIGIDSRAAVTVFPKTVAEGYLMLQTPDKQKELQASVRQAFAGFGCAQSAGQAQRRVSQVRESESGGHAQSFCKYYT